MRMIPVVSRMCAVLFPGPSYCFLMVQQITVDIEAEFPHSSSDFLLFKRCEYLCRCAHTCVHRRAESRRQLHLSPPGRPQGLFLAWSSPIQLD